MEDFWITHYLPRRTQRFGWVQVPCITRRFEHRNESLQKDTFYYGFETDQPLSQDFINRLVESKEARPVDYLYHIQREQRLWLSPDGELWLASQSDPLGDSRKVLVDRLNAPYIPCVVWDKAANSEDLAKSLVLRTSIQNASIEAFPGDYLLSKEHLRGRVNIREPKYLPTWQKHLAQRVARDVRQIASQMKSERPNLSFLPYQEHDYRNVEETIVGRRVALPYEVIFQTTRRMRSISILPYGNIAHFALVYFPESMIESDLELRSEEEFAGSCADLFERIEKLSIQVCAPTHTAVDDLLTDAITDRQLSWMRKDDENHVSKLVRWISSSGHDRVIACDTGIAFQILAEGFREGGDLDRLQFARVRYEEPLAAGMAYIREDQVWGSYLKSVISEEFRSPDEEVQKSLMDFRTRFKEVDGVWAPSAELCAA